METLEHSGIAITMDIYAHVMRQKQRESAGSSTRSSSARSTASIPCSPGHDSANDTRPAPANATTTTTAAAVGSNDHELRLQYQPSSSRERLGAHRYAPGGRLISPPEPSARSP
jgi:hypothetical protein